MIYVRARSSEVGWLSFTQVPLNPLGHRMLSSHPRVHAPYSRRCQSGSAPLSRDSGMLRGPRWLSVSTRGSRLLRRLTVMSPPDAPRSNGRSRLSGGDRLWIRQSNVIIGGRVSIVVSVIESVAEAMWIAGREMWLVGPLGERNAPSVARRATGGASICPGKRDCQPAKRDCRPASREYRFGSRDIRRASRDLLRRTAALSRDRFGYSLLRGYLMPRLHQRWQDALPRERSE
jgi:hypothetical protein